MVINDFDKFVEAHKKEGGRVLEVTTKTYYILEPYEKRPVEEIKQDWFVEYAGRCHAYKDGAKIFGKEEVTEIKEL